MELLLIVILALLAFLCVTGELKSLRDRRHADHLVRLRSSGQRAGPLLKE